MNDNKHIVTQYNQHYLEFEKYIKFAFKKNTKA